MSVDLTEEQLVEIEEAFIRSSAPVNVEALGAAWYARVRLMISALRDERTANERLNRAVATLDRTTDELADSVLELRAERDSLRAGIERVEELADKLERGSSITGPGGAIVARAFAAQIRAALAAPTGQEADRG